MGKNIDGRFCDSYTASLTGTMDVIIRNKGGVWGVRPPDDQLAGRTARGAGRTHVPAVASFSSCGVVNNWISLIILVKRLLVN